MGVGPAIVLLHGFPESGTLWQNIWHELCASFTLIIPDFPGSGNSVLDEETSIADMATCVKNILDAEQIDKAVIAGHSMGGYVAFAFAGLYPDKLAGLSLVHSTAVADDDEKKNTRRKAIELIRKGAKEAFITQMVPNLFSYDFKQSNSLAVKQQVDEALKMNDASLINFYEAMIGRTDHTFVLEKAGYPVQWIIGMDDNVIYYKKILEQCNKSNINFVSFYRNCGHMSMIETPQKLANDLKEFAVYCYNPTSK
jgi:pimeloyl-ACP methyl ester carboxylesterase